MAQSNGNGSVRVDIYDQTYQLRGSDPEYIGKLAQYVDTKMRLIAQQASTVDSLRVAVLAALNIADEYLILKGKYDSIASDYHARAEQCRARSTKCWKSRGGWADTAVAQTAENFIFLKREATPGFLLIL